MEQPKLIEPMAKHYLFETLKTCHHIRVNMYSYALNIGVFLLFSILFASALYYSKQNRLSDYEKHKKMQLDQQYVLSKIRYYQESNTKERETSSSNISGLPGL